jgi:hypothetical protein
MRSREYIATAITAVVVIALIRAGTQPVGVETMLESYRSWKDLTPQPELVPYELAIQCARVTPEQLERARKNHGLHALRGCGGVCAFAIQAGLDLSRPFSSGPSSLGRLLGNLDPR